MSRLGRFSSPDPLAGAITNPQSLNRYTYVLNDPCNLVDPLGLKCTLIFGLNGGSLSDATEKQITNIFQNAGVDVQFVSGSGDFSIQQNVFIGGGVLGKANFKEGIAEVDNAGINAMVKMNNLDATTSQAYDSAMAIVTSHELGHLTTDCYHNPGPGHTDCGNTGLMSQGKDHTETYLDPAVQTNPSQFQFTTDQGKAIQEKCKTLHPQQPRKGGGGGGGPTHAGGDGPSGQSSNCFTGSPNSAIGMITACNDGNTCITVWGFGSGCYGPGGGGRGWDSWE
jgi:hypothetical protein